MALQRTTWENGTTVVVNFSNEPLPHQVSSGQDVVLAPLGYWAEGPEILQTRTIEDGNIIKRIETETFRQAETVKRVKVGPVEVEGNFMAFRMPEGHWQMVVEPRRVTEIDIAALTGWERDAPVSLVELDRFGEAVAAVPAAMKDGVLKLQPGEGSRFFALHGNTPRTTPLFYPAAGELILGQPVVATYPVEGAVVRATMDGSEPTMRSPRLPYGGLVPKDSVTIKARAFVDGRAVGEVAEAHYDGVRRLHGSEVMRSGDAPRFVTVPLKGGTRLRLRVGYADDHPWADWVDLGEPRLVRADGTMVKLGELEPAKKFQVYEDVTVNIRDDDGPLVVGGRTFADGLGLRSEAEVIWEIGEDFDRLEMWMGINDRAAQNAQLIQGTATVTLDLLP
jgi:hypothetical protein